MLQAVLKTRIATLKSRYTSIPIRNETKKRYCASNTEVKQTIPIYHTSEGPVPKIWTNEHMTQIEHELKKMPRVVIRNPEKTSDKPVKRAAVLVPLVNHGVMGSETPIEASILYTLRSSRLRSHGGQVAFPGGVMDEADGGDPIITALRETEEEIGLDRNKIRVLGVFHDVVSLGGLIVTPVISYIPDPRDIHSQSLILSATEVEEAFVVPLSTLVRPDVYKVEQLNRGKIPRFMVQPSRTEQDIWGMTAYLTDWFLKSIVCKL